jgi:acyl-CoA synthetase (AMP-forming)/AMP-acid ligase II
MTTFPERLQELHSRMKDRVAVILQFSGRDDLTVTYDQLLCGANAYARAFEDEGIQPGEVAILFGGQFSMALSPPSCHS